MKVLKKYRDRVLEHYEQTMLKTNLAKSSASSTLIAAGLILVQQALTSAHLDQQLLAVGAILVVLGYVTNYLGDVHKVERKREEIDLLNDAIRAAGRKIMRDVQKSITDYLTEEIEKKVYDSLSEARKRRKRYKK